MLDLTLAICHHLLVFAIFGVLWIEWVLVRPGLTLSALRTIAAMDLAYGAAAGLVIVIGFARVIWAAKGWDYYSHNVFFWAKIGVFLMIGLLSIGPTISFLTWRRAQQLPGEGAIRAVRRVLSIELALFVLLPAFAAAMARGYGQLPH